MQKYLKFFERIKIKRVWEYKNIILRKELVILKAKKKKKANIALACRYLQENCEKKKKKIPQEILIKNNNIVWITIVVNSRIKLWDTSDSKFRDRVYFTRELSGMLYTPPLTM